MALGTQFPHGFKQKGVDTYAKLLLHCNGSDASTTVTDSSASAKTVTVQGNAQLDTAQFRFGTASLLLDGTGDYITVPDSDDWSWGSGDGTFDMWIRYNSVPSTHFLLAQRVDSTTGQFCFYSGGSFAYSQLNSGSTVVSYGGATTPSTGVWYHFALDKVGSLQTMFWNGAILGQVTDADSHLNFSAILNIGSDSSGSSPFNGWMDELRWTKGVSRYQGQAFKPPERAYT